MEKVNFSEEPRGWNVAQEAGGVTRQFNPQPLRCVGAAPTAECTGESGEVGEQKPGGRRSACA